MKPIKNILFDLGGVLFHISYQHCFDAFKEIAKIPLETHFKQLAQSDLLNKVDEGKISEREFLPAIRKLVEIYPHVTDQAIMEAWDKILVGPAPGWKEVLEKLSKKYKLYLLSNNNEMHLSSIKRSYPATSSFQVLESYFKELHYSHTLGIRKPKIESYLEVIKRCGIDPTETLFIDDTLPNIEVAREVKLQTFHFEHNGPLTQLDFLNSLMNE
ncbi:MAG: HAD family phosphatase [Bacteriovoracaceae bacterium]|nr:HAD family phosphatase [Bacteriovoracaceae bacterium]